MQKREEKTEGELRNKGGEKVDRNIGGRHQGRHVPAPE